VLSVHALSENRPEVVITSRFAPVEPRFSLPALPLRVALKAKLYFSFMQYSPTMLSGFSVFPDCAYRSTLAQSYSPWFLGSRTIQ